MTSQTSPDGLLTVVTDDDHGGVLLVADFTSLTPKPVQVQFLRNGLPVRSGDPALAPGGYGIAYDHEATLGKQAQWVAVPTYRRALNVAWPTADGLYEGTPSQPVGLSVPDIAGAVDCWVKPIAAPGLSIALPMIYPAPELGDEPNVALTQVPGARYPAATWNKRSPSVPEYTLRTRTIDELDQLRAAFDEGPVLVQTRRTFGLPDLFAQPGSHRESVHGKATSGRRTVTIQLQPIKRPPTIDAPLYVPGRSYDETHDAALTYAQSTTTWATYRQILMGAMPPVDPVVDGGDGEGGTV